MGAAIFRMSTPDNGYVLAALSLSPRNSIWRVVPPRNVPSMTAPDLRRNVSERAGSTTESSNTKAVFIISPLLHRGQDRCELQIEQHQNLVLHLEETCGRPAGHRLTESLEVLL